MPYATSGLRRTNIFGASGWVLYTTDSLATAVGAGYVSDGTSSTTSGTPGKGMRVGDPVQIIVVGAIPPSGEAPTTCTAIRMAVCTTANTTTGACSLTAAS